MVVLLQVGLFKIHLTSCSSSLPSAPEARTLCQCAKRYVIRGASCLELMTYKEIKGAANLVVKSILIKLADPLNFTLNLQNNPK